MAEITVENADDELAQVISALHYSLERHCPSLKLLHGRRQPGECSEVQIHLGDDSWEQRERAIDGVLEARLRLLREGLSFHYCFGGFWPPLEG